MLSRNAYVCRWESPTYVKKNTASSTSRIEKEMAHRAQKGPLTIMRSLAQEANKESKPSS